jgi:hypothetical protein
MEIWISDNWFNLASVVGIIASLLFTAVSLRSETKNRRIESLLFLTESHRELWSRIFDHPELSRVLDENADLKKHPVSLAESIYAGLAIQHLGSAYQAMKGGVMIQQDGLCDDVRSFFALPIPKAAWEESKKFQNDDFVAFVEKCRRGGARLLKRVAFVLRIAPRNHDHGAARERSGHRIVITAAFPSTFLI